MSIFGLSKVAANNTSCHGVNTAENSMGPGEVNNYARANAAALKQWQEDTGGALTSGGSANAQTITTNSGITALVDGLRLSFVAGFTNTDAMTFIVDGLAAKAGRKVTGDSANDVALIANDIRINGHYEIEYDASANSAAGAWVVLNPAPPAISTFGRSLIDDTTALAARTTLGFLIGSTTVNPPPIDQGDAFTVTCTVPGAAVGDFAVANIPGATQYVMTCANVVSANTVRVNIHVAMLASSAIDIASFELRVVVIPLT